MLIMKRMTLPIMKWLMKTFEVKCLILMVKRVTMLISDFLGVEDILNYPNNDGEFYADEEN